MNNPFFPNHWSHSHPPRHPYYYYSPSPQPVHQHPQPVHQHPQPVQHNSARKPSSSGPKVVQIPVQYISSEPARSVPARSKSKSAVKIQKAFRGFLVRKGVEKIKEIKNEVDEIEKRVSRSEFVELLKKNERERLKVNEMLMGLLFKLDSIRGFCSGVRECRKAVIKKAIALQERVDAMVTAKIDGTETVKEENMTEIHQSDEQREDSVKIEDLESEESEEQNEARTQCTRMSQIAGHEERKEDSVNIEVESEGNEALKSGEMEKVRASSAENGANLDENKVEDEKVESRVNNKSVEEKGVGVDLETNDEEDVYDGEQKGMWGVSVGVEKSNRENAAEGGESKVEGEKVEKRGKEEVCDEEGKGMWGVSECVENVDEGGEENDDDLETKEGEAGGGNDEIERNRELLERMMEDNAKMMSLMTQLYERNEMQMRMLNSLTQRVEQLEKAFVCDRMRRKKKRHGA